MFSDSKSATLFTSYIRKFSLAPYITKELVKDVNELSGGFIVKSDECLNKKMKNGAIGHPPALLEW